MRRTATSQTSSVCWMQLVRTRWSLSTTAPVGNFDVGSRQVAKQEGRPAGGSGRLGRVCQCRPEHLRHGERRRIGVDDEGINWRTAGYWAKLRDVDGESISELGLRPTAFTIRPTGFLAVNHDAPVGIEYWEVGNEINGNGYYAPYWNWEQDSRSVRWRPDGRPVLSPTTMLKTLFNLPRR